MTIIETSVTLGLDIDMGDEVPHVECCRVPRFFCGRDHHPELVAREEDPDEECCPTCIKILRASLCPPWNPTHSHCPIPLMADQMCPEAR